FFKHNYPGAKIIAFEPDESNFELASSNLKEWRFENVELIPKAIWTHNEHIQFQQSHDMGSAIVQGESAESQNIKKIPCQRLRDLLEEPADFLKLDIEGAEYEVVQDCADKL